MSFHTLGMTRLLALFCGGFIFLLVRSVYAEEFVEFRINIEKLYPEKALIHITTLLPEKRFGEFSMKVVSDKGFFLMEEMVFSANVVVPISSLKPGDADFFSVFVRNKKTGEMYYSNKIRVIRPINHMPATTIMPQQPLSFQIIENVQNTSKLESSVSMTSMLAMFDGKYTRYLFLFIPLVVGLLLALKLTKIEDT